MFKETYERLEMDVTIFDVEDVITTSEVNNTKKLSNYAGKYEFIPNGL